MSFCGLILNSVLCVQCLGISTVFGLNQKIDRLYHWLFITLMSVTSLLWRTLMADPTEQRHQRQGRHGLHQRQQLLMKVISVMS